ncbi:MAG TPA: PKD domain-containing protein, partial [Ferruginibacter sp.]|nr:PKD domain-containing protein [Ferruginibacter sp.]
MRKFLLLSIAVIFAAAASAQDQTNKGKEFWISYPEHINGTSSVMGLYITSDVNTTGVVTVNGTNIPFGVNAYTVTNLFLGPNGGGSAPNSYIHMGGIQDGIKTGAAVHIVSQEPVVVYSHIIFSARSGASLILPTQVWGKEYIVPSYPNSGGSGAGQGYGELNVMASLPNTVVEITPQITSRNGLRTAGIPYQITLVNPGDVYQLQFPQNQDLSGTVVRSIASGTSGCQPIAVVAATTWTALNCGSGTGGDNFYQQLFPYGSWGKEFLTAPLKKVVTNPNDHNVDIVRVYVKDPATVVQKTENGTTTTLLGLNFGNYYEYSTEYPTYIKADQPIQLMQYIKTQNCNAAGSPQTESDPEMIALSAVEQTINDVTVFSAFQAYVPPGQSNVTTHYINVIMKTANTGSFRVNGAAPTATWVAIPATNYSYLKQNIITTGPGATPVTRLQADSGFSAIAYGFGNVESYGYNAGTNVIDLSHQLEVQSQYGIETSPTVCKDAPFKFKVYFPDSTLSVSPVAIRYDSIKWSVNNPGVFVPNNFPITVLGTVGAPPTVAIDSVNIRNGRQVAWYSLPGLYSVNTPGVYTITITTYRTSSEGCGNQQDYTFQLTVVEPPVAGFTYTAGKCVAEPYQFTETTPQAPKPTYRWYWNFGDPGSGASNTSTVRNPTHIFSAPGTYTVAYVAYTTAGCETDTVRQQVVVDPIPSAIIDGTNTVCINGAPQTITFTGSGSTAAAPSYTFYYHMNAGGPLSVSSIGTSTASIVHNPTTAGPYVYTLDSVRITGSAACVKQIVGQQITITVLPNHAIALTTANNVQTRCINNAIAD